MSDRDTLAEALDNTRDLFQESADIAECLISAGWRPPARVITDPAELDALPLMSIATDYHDLAWQAMSREYGEIIWEAARMDPQTSVDLLSGGARVQLVYVPTEEATDEDQ